MTKQVSMNRPTRGRDRNRSAKAGLAADGQDTTVIIKSLLRIANQRRAVLPRSRSARTCQNVQGVRCPAQTFAVHPGVQAVQLPLQNYEKCCAHVDEVRLWSNY